MTPKFRLEDAYTPILLNPEPEVISALRVYHSNIPYKRCDTPPTNCSGCDCAALKEAQRDIRIYSKVA